AGSKRLSPKEKARSLKLRAFSLGLSSFGAVSSPTVATRLPRVDALGDRGQALCDGRRAHALLRRPFGRGGTSHHHDHCLVSRLDVVDTGLRSDLVEVATASHLVSPTNRNRPTMDSAHDNEIQDRKSTRL